MSAADSGVAEGEGVIKRGRSARHKERAGKKDDMAV
jgi:hypothetical protein